MASAGWKPYRRRKALPLYVCHLHFYPGDLASPSNHSALSLTYESVRPSLWWRWYLYEGEGVPCPLFCCLIMGCGQAKAWWKRRQWKAAHETMPASLCMSSLSVWGWLRPHHHQWRKMWEGRGLSSHLWTETPAGYITHAWNLCPSCFRSHLCIS